MYYYVRVMLGDGHTTETIKGLLSDKWGEQEWDVRACPPDSDDEPPIFQAHTDKKIPELDHQPKIALKWGSSVIGGVTVLEVY